MVIIFKIKPLRTAYYTTQKQPDLQSANLFFNDFLHHPEHRRANSGAATSNWRNP